MPAYRGMGLDSSRDCVEQCSRCELMAEDIRWQQRFSNYTRALAQLEAFIDPPAQNER